RWNGRKLDIFAARSLQHLGFRYLHSLHHRHFVLSPLMTDVHGRDTPRIDLVLVQLHVVLVIRQALAKAAKGKAPGSGTTKLMLELDAKAGHLASAHPVCARTAALEAIAAHKIRKGIMHVAEARDINAVGTVADLHAIFVTRNDAGGSAMHNVVHQVVAKLATGVCETRGKF